MRAGTDKHLFACHDPLVTLRLHNGAAFEIRPIRPQDKARLTAAHAHLSDESVRRRFLSAKPRLSTTDLRYLTEVDGSDHVALVAVPAGASGPIVAVARFVRQPDDPETAEFAIVVADAYQQLGLGRALAIELATRARDIGVRRFSAVALADNLAVRRLLDRIAVGLRHAGHHDGVQEIVVELAA